MCRFLAEEFLTEESADIEDVREKCYTKKIESAELLRTQRSQDEK